MDMNKYYRQVNDTTYYYNEQVDLKNDVIKEVISLTFGKPPMYMDKSVDREIYYHQLGLRYVLIDKIGMDYKVYSGDSPVPSRRPQEVTNVLSTLTSFHPLDPLDKLPLIVSFNANNKEQYNDAQLRGLFSSILIVNKEAILKGIEANPAMKKYIVDVDSHIKSAGTISGRHELMNKYHNDARDYLIGSFGVVNNADLSDLVKSLDLDKKYPESFFIASKKYIAESYDLLSGETFDLIEGIFDGAKNLPKSNPQTNVVLSNKDNRVTLNIDSSIIVIDKKKDKGSYNVYCRDYDSVGNFINDIDSGKFNRISELVMSFDRYSLLELDEGRYQEMNTLLMSAMTSLDDIGLVVNRERNNKLN